MRYVFEHDGFDSRLPVSSEELFQLNAFFAAASNTGAPLGLESGGKQQAACPASTSWSATVEF